MLRHLISQNNAECNDIAKMLIQQPMLQLIAHKTLLDPYRRQGPMCEVTSNELLRLALASKKHDVIAMLYALPAVKAEAIKNNFYVFEHSDSICCPISLENVELKRQFVSLEEGDSYDADVLLEWVTKNTTFPLTRRPLSNLEKQALKDTLSLYAYDTKNFEAMFFFRRFKTIPFLVSPISFQNWSLDEKYTWLEGLPDGFSFLLNFHQDVLEINVVEARMVAYNVSVLAKQLVQMPNHPTTGKSILEIVIRKLALNCAFRECDVALKRLLNALGESKEKQKTFLRLKTNILLECKEILLNTVGTSLSLTYQEALNKRYALIETINTALKKTESERISEPADTLVSSQEQQEINQSLTVLKLKSLSVTGEKRPIVLDAAAFKYNWKLYKNNEIDFIDFSGCRLIAVDLSPLTQTEIQNLFALYDIEIQNPKTNTDRLYESNEIKWDTDADVRQTETPSSHVASPFSLFGFDQNKRPAGKNEQEKLCVKKFKPG